MDEADEDEDEDEEQEQEQEQDEVVQPAATPTGSPNSGSPESVYRRLTSKEHIRFRPDTYIGSPQMSHGQMMWVYDEDGGMNRREISYVPGLYKIFDEIMVNAADNYERMTRLDVTIDAKTNTITIRNDGEGNHCACLVAFFTLASSPHKGASKHNSASSLIVCVLGSNVLGIPVVWHSEENMYVPQLVFGYLYTSSNYGNGTEDKDTAGREKGGRNGLGAKLANMFATRFRVDCLDSRRRKRFRMEWENNMRTRRAPVVTDVVPKRGSPARDYTEISFVPDLQRFGFLFGCSTNGTYLNDTLIGKGNKRRLTHGDHLSLVMPISNRPDGTRPTAHGGRPTPL
jgi:DNA topoisomerase-2